jgi:4-alpha-glucanotransferase
VFRWEREWQDPGQPFKDPRGYEALSVATSGTHDTEPLVTWWAQAGRQEREAVLAIPSIRESLTAGDITTALDSPELTHSVHEAMLSALYGSGSNLLLLPIQDVFGWTDRVNQPATVGDGNWTWRLKWPVDRLSVEPEAIEKAVQLKAWTERSGRR